MIESLSLRHYLPDPTVLYCVSP